MPDQKTHAKVRLGTAKKLILGERLLESSLRGRDPNQALPQPAPDGGLMQRLLEAAADIFIAEGFDGASTNEIARRANASKTTFYSRFSTKEKLFLAVVEHRMGKVFTEVHSALPLDPPISLTLRRFASRVLAVSHSEGQSVLIKMIGMEANRFPELGKQFYKLGPGRGQTVLADYLTEHIRRGTLRAEDPQVMAEHFFGLLLGATLLWFVLGVRSSMPDEQEQHKRVETAVDTFLRAYVALP